MATSAVILLAGLGSKCEGDGSGGTASVAIGSVDQRCAALPDPLGFPPGWDFVPGVPGRVLAAVFSPPTLVPLDIDTIPFQSPADAVPFVLPSDADGDGLREPFQAIDDVFGVSPDLALVTLSGFEAVLFVDPHGGLRTVELETPLALPGGAPRGWPPPGPANATLRTGLQNFLCIVPAPGALDSRGAVFEPDSRRDCRAGVASFRSNFTAGAALAAGHLFVPVSNLGADRNTDHTQFLPAAVTVYDVDFDSDPPRVSPSIATPDGEPFILSSARADSRSFNATHTTAYTTPGGREFVLVLHTGAIGIPMDDPRTRVIEGGATRLTDGSLDVIDAVALRLVASIPLRDANPSFGGPAIDPTGRVAMLGDITSRRLYAIDLAPLEDLPPAGTADVQVLTNAVIFDGTAGRRLEIPALPNGAPEATCPGAVLGLAFSDDGERLYAIDSCDGSFAVIAVDLSGDPPAPVPPDRFAVVLDPPVLALTAPLREDTAGLPRQPVALMVRPGEPGVDFSGPDVLFLVSEPEGQLCGLHIESSESAP